MARRTCLIGLVLFIAVVGLAGHGWSASDDLRTRLQTLWNEGRYDLARDLLEDHLRRGAEATPPLRWWALRLQDDPDRFDREALELGAALPADSPLRARVVLARATEQYARGRYETAATLLDAPVGDATLAPRFALLRGICRQALGDLGAAERDFVSVAESAPSERAMAMALLADLRARAGRTEAAQAAAEEAIRLDEARAGAIAHAVLARTAEALGDAERAARERAILGQRFPRSPEAGWRPASAPRPARPFSAELPEVDVSEGRSAYSLQFGAFHDRSLALRRARALARSLPEVSLEIDRSGAQPLYRVVAGRYLTRNEAERALAALEGREEAVIVGPQRRSP